MEQEQNNGTTRMYIVHLCYLKIRNRKFGGELEAKRTMARTSTTSKIRI